jgi:hypothetical protein
MGSLRMVMVMVMVRARVMVMVRVVMWVLMECGWN